MRSRISGALSYFLGEGLGPFLVRAVAGSSAVQAAGMLVTFLVGVQLARGLGVEGYGYYGIAMAVITIAGVPGEYGIPKLVTREVAAASASDDRPRMFGVLRFADRATWVLAALALLTAVLLAFFLSAERSSIVITAILLGLPIVPLAAFARSRGGALQGLHHVVLGQIPFNLVRPLLMALLLLGLFTWNPGAGAPEAMALNVATAAAALVLSELWLRSRLPAERPARLTQASRQWLASCVPLTLARAIGVLHGQTIILVLGILATSADVGLFRIALSTMAVVGLPVMLMNQVVAPVLAKLYAEGDQGRLRKVCTRASQAMTAAVMALTLPLVLWGRPLIRAIFGEDYVPAYAALLLMCAAQIVSAAFGPNATLLTMTHHERRVTRAMTLGLLVNVALVAALAPMWGVTGAALAGVGGALFWNSMAWFDAKRLLDIDTSLFPRPSAAFPPRAS